MRHHITCVRTIMLLAAVAAGCADSPTAADPIPLLGSRQSSCGKSNTGTVVCSSLTGSLRPSASYTEHSVTGKGGTTFTSYAQPTAAYLQGTTKIDISGLTDLSFHSSISDGFQTVDLQVGGPLQKRTVPGTWYTWSSPPESESATPAVLQSSATVLTALKFSVPVAVVGFELEGNQLGETHDFLVEFYDDNYELIGFVVRSVAADAGARLFSFSTNWTSKISRVDISAAGGPSFAIAQVRYSLTELPPAPSPLTAISIDIKPGTAPNDVQRNSKGKLPVAVISTPDFDATSLDLASITLGDETGTDTPVAMQNKKTFMAAFQDVDADGDLDLVLQFEIQALVANGDLTASTTELVLRGTRTGGSAVRGVDNVVVKP